MGRAGLLNLVEVRLGKTFSALAPLALALQTPAPRVLPLDHQVDAMGQRVDHSGRRRSERERLALKVDRLDINYNEHISFIASVAA